MSAIRTHLLVMILAGSSPAEEGIPVTKSPKIQAATEVIPVETVELGAYNNCIGTMSSVLYVLCKVINIGGRVCRLCIEITTFTIVQDSVFILQIGVVYLACITSNWPASLDERLRIIAQPTAIH